MTRCGASWSWWRSPRLPPPVAVRQGCRWLTPAATLPATPTRVGSSAGASLPPPTTPRQALARQRAAGQVPSVRRGTSAQTRRERRAGTQTLVVVTSAGRHTARRSAAGRVGSRRTGVVVCATRARFRRTCRAASAWGFSGHTTRARKHPPMHVRRRAALSASRAPPGSSVPTRSSAGRRRAEPGAFWLRGVRHQAARRCRMAGADGHALRYRHLRRLFRRSM